MIHVYIFYFLLSVYRMQIKQTMGHQARVTPLPQPQKRKCVKYNVKKSNFINLWTVNVEKFITEFNSQLKIKLTVSSKAHTLKVKIKEIFSYKDKNFSAIFWANYVLCRNCYRVLIDNLVNCVTLDKFLPMVTIQRQKKILQLQILG